MHARHRLTLRLSALAALLIATLWVAALSGSPAAAAPAQAPARAPLAATLPATSCSLVGTVRTCELWATTGSLTLPGGVLMPIWGYSSSATPGTAQLPGPALIVNAGETVQVILHNMLAESSAMVFDAQAMLPDLAGVAPGGTTTYSFVAANPGTFLYEAGLTANGYHQTALGMYGALVVRPAGNPLGQAYDNASTAFDDEALVVLSEIDPVLNTSADPAAFDIRDYMPRYWLINGKAYPDSDPIPTQAGRRVLLRYVNAGLQHHSMALLGLRQTVLAMDGNLTMFSHRMVAETQAPGQTTDVLVTVPASVVGTRFPLYDGSLLLINNPPAGFGGMLTFLTLPDVVPGPDTLGPATTNAAAAPAMSDGSVDLAVSALVSDVASGNANVVAAEYFVDAPGANGAGVAMAATDGAFDSPTEAVNAVITAATVSGWTSGSHTIYVNGQDAGGAWGPLGSATLVVDKAGPISASFTLVPNPSRGDVDIALSGSGNEMETGGNDIMAAEYFIDAAGGEPVGSGSTMTVNTMAMIASLDAVIPAATAGALTEGVHVVSVRSQDTLGNWGPFGTVDLLIDRTGPTTANVHVQPNPNNGMVGVSASNASVRLDASLVDPLTPAVNGAQSTIKAVEGFFDVAGAPGTGFPLNPNDGLFDEYVEDGYAFIPLPTIAALSNGPHPILVHGQDAAGNWGATSSAILMIDKTAPAVTNVVAYPNPTLGATSILLVATATDPGGAALGTNLVAAQWFEGADPGPGNGTAMMPVDGVFNSRTEFLVATINVAGWAMGPHTLSVRVRDAAGNWSPVGSVVLNVTLPVGVSKDTDDR